MDKILKLLKQKSTWLGLTTIATALGLTLSTDLINSIVAAGMSVAGLIAVLFDEDK